MDRNCGIAVALLACVSMLTSGEVDAQGPAESAASAQRGAKVDPVAEHAAKLAELDAWLRRLVGRFRISTLTPAPYSGRADCTGIGSGAGVHCVLSTQPFDQARRVAPTMVLYGLDPDTLEVRYLQVDNGSIAEGDVGRLSGDRIVFRVQCPIMPHPPTSEGSIVVLSCRREVQIYAASNGKFVQIDDRKYERVRVCGGRRCRTLDLPPIPKVLLLQRLPEDRADDAPEPSR